MPRAAEKQTRSSRRLAVALSAALCAAAFCLTASATNFVVTNAADSGPGSLRQAIDNANASPGCDHIGFSLVPFMRTISVASQLPAIRDCLTMSGGAEGITLDGGEVGDASGLVIESSDVAIERVAVVRFERDGIIASGGVRIELLEMSIGTDLGRTLRLGNGAAGIRVMGSVVVVGGSTIGANDTGIVVDESSLLSLGGSAVGGEPLGNIGNGIELGGQWGNIGSYPCPFECPAYVSGNVIANNGGSGIVLSGQRNVIVYDQIFGNREDGIRVIGGLANTVYANTIRDNRGSGVGVVAGSCGITSNRISANGGPPIDLGDDGPTPNDPLDSDTGPNGLANAPVLTDAIVEPFGTTVVGDVEGMPDSDVYVDLYAATACEQPAREMFPAAGREVFPAGGQTRLHTDHAGHASLHAVVQTLPAEANVSFFLATSTSEGGTSEASNCIAARESSQVNADLSVEYAPLAGPVAPGSRVTFVIKVTNHGPAAATGVWIDSPIPVGGVVESDSTTHGYCYLTGLGFCTLGGLAAGQTAVIEKTVRVGEQTISIVDTASIRHFDQPDPVVSNDAALSNIDVGYLRRHSVRRGQK